MASLPSVAVTGTLKLEQELRKHSSFSLTTEKGLLCCPRADNRVVHVVRVHSLYSNSTPLPVVAAASGIQSLNLSYSRSNSATKFDGSSEPKSLDFREALFLIKEGTQVVESSCYIPLLQECIARRSGWEAKIVHSHIVKTGTHQDSFLMTFLVNVYSKCGAMEDAHKVFDKLAKRNVVTWTALMTGYVHNSQPESAIQLFLEMLEAGGYPTNYSLVAVVSACSLLYSIELGKQIHAYSIKYQVDSDTSLGNSLCSLYSKCGRLECAVNAFRRIKEKNVISWTAFLSACGDNGEAEMGLRLFPEMLADNVEPNEFTLTNVLGMCCIMQDLGLGAQIHSLSIKLGYEQNLLITRSTMYMYLKSGSIDDAQKLFEVMETINLVAWNAMIAGHSQVMSFATDNLSAFHSGIRALSMFLKMNRAGLKSDLFTFSSVLTVCSSMVALEQGEQIHAQTIKTGFLSDVVVGTSLINMYSKCGSIERASKAFVEMPFRTLISWTSMITGFAQQGQSELALRLFEDMRLVGARPNKITFVGVLSACCHAGMVDEALQYFEMMTNEYRIKPVMDHFACMIDMYVRLGRLDEAFDFIKNMEFQPNEFTWSNLIAGCRSHGNLELGFYAAEQLLELEPKDTETYVFLLNMYLTAGRYEDVFRMRKLMIEKQLRKLNNWSWISIKDKVHSFEPNSQLHLQSAEMYALLGDLLDRAKSIGYESETIVDVSDNEDEEKTSFTTDHHHSEKLAIAFGLLNTINAAPIRVLKSISMCRDCHSFVKFISILTNREIIIRDSKRLHKFVKGQCSCGDFAALI